ncbi:hypothetical protein D0T49_06950 [Paludibacter sp. 221]|uniref:IS1096 element passenger TnpR family protein n=1 Tax=Paludibacter sp. 221 TaxID=2302939 RepID=UPI0013D00802|nr:hypothetical protein [Paludibacter sp. 221]NDV46782.1 hypothetical protein [Paludibacter sp. 221]
MVYKFTILSDEVDDFVRVINIDAEATFFDLHEAILDSVNYTKDQMTSFFLCSDDWEREQEITLIEMDTDSEYDNLVMDSTVLEDYITDEKQKLQYVFDIVSDRAFFIELGEIATGKNLDKAKCTVKDGDAPEQMYSDNIQTITSKVLLDDSFYGDEDFDISELDDEGFGEEGFDESMFSEEPNF